MRVISVGHDGFARTIDKAAFRVQHRFAFSNLALSGVARGDGPVALFLSLDSPAHMHWRIAAGQFQPFLDEQAFIARALGLAPLFRHAGGAAAFPDALRRRCAVVCFQPAFDWTVERYAEDVATLRAAFPDARLVHFDYTAPTSMPLGAAAAYAVDAYVKKHVLADRTAYAGDGAPAGALAARIAATGLPFAPAGPPVPANLLDRLIVGPTFYMEYQMARTFARTPPDLAAARRPIDLHARIMADGAEWYRRYRGGALEAVRRIEGRGVVSDGLVARRRYLREISESKFCFSPFGYGEICFRDFEAMAGGAVVIKPDTSHVELDPPFLAAGETYLATRWDFADLPDVLDRALADDAGRVRMAREAFSRIAAYVRERTRIAAYVRERRHRDFIRRVLVG